MTHQLNDFESKLDNVYVIGISGMDENELLYGRPYGGCAIIYNRQFKCNVTPIVHDSKRCMAAIITVDTCRFLFFNVYMPCDGNNNQYDPVFNDVLHDINLLINQYSDIDHIIIGGDLNTDVSRLGSSHTTTLHEFCNRESLFMCVNHAVANIDYTYESSLGARSTVDHFIVSDNLIDSVVAYDVLYDGDNLSDHKAIHLSLAIPVSHQRDEEKLFTPTTTWRKATEDQINNYKSKLRSLLNEVVIPPFLLHCDNILCDIHHDDINKYYDDIVAACNEATKSSIPASSKRKRVAGWSEYVQPYKNRSVFWHKIWRENDSMRQGVLFDIMQKTRANYKRVSRHVLKSQNSLKTERIASSLLKDNKRDFWQEVRNISRSHKQRASEMNGIHGDVGISGVFHDKYQTLYTSVPYDQSAMNNINHNVEHNLTVRCINGECDVSHDICIDDVITAVRKMKLFKSDANFELFSNNLIHACDELYMHLANLFNCMLHHGYCPESMNLSTLIPIPKSSKKSISDISNYRAIALGSVVGKVLDNVILFKNIDYLCTSELQFGFKPNHSTTQCSFVLQEVIDLYKRNDSSLYLILLDASQAFDRVQYCKLFDIMLKRNVCSCTVRLLINMYTTQRLRVRWGNAVSDSFMCTNGVKQGGVLSPILFCIYMDELLIRLTKSGIGCHVGNTFFGALCYADDVTILTPSRNSMTEMLRLCEEFANEYNVKFNSSKSVLVTLNVNVDVSFKLNNIPIIKADNAVHLGHYVGKNYNQKNISAGVSNLIGRTNIMLSRFGICSSLVKSALFKTYCTSYYGCALWSLASPDIERVYVTWRKIIRRLWNVPYRTHSNLLPVLFDDYSIGTQLLFRFSKFILKVYNSDNAHTSMCAKLAYFSKTPAANNIRILAQKLNTHSVFSCASINNKDKIVNNDNICDDVKSIGNCVRELCCIRDGSHTCDMMNNSEVKFMIDVLCCM